MADDLQILRLCPHDHQCDLCYLYMLAESMADITGSEEAATRFFEEYLDFAIPANDCGS